MKIIPRDNLPDIFLPLPIWSSVHIADAIGRDGQEFSVFIGLEKKYVDQLRRLSLDKSDVDLQKHTGDRARFGEGSYEEWYEKDRTPFCLIHKQTDDLAALIWLGRKSLGKKSIKFGKDKEKDDQIGEEYSWHTISCRSYPHYRGKGIMKNFIKYSIDFYKNKFPNIKFWTGMDDRNAILFKIFSDLDFEIDKKNSDLSDNWLVMVK